MRDLLFGHDQTVANWVVTRFKVEIWPHVAAIGVLHDGDLVGAAILQEYNGHNVELSYYGPGGLSPSLIRKLARLLFWNYKVQRVTVRTRRKNKCITRAITKFGFAYEGVMKRFYGPHKADDAVLYGLMRENLGRLARVTI